MNYDLEGFPIEELISSIPDGERRFFKEKVDQKLIYFPYTPDFTDELKSAHNEYTIDDNNIYEDFKYEIAAIKQVMKKYDIEAIDDNNKSTSKIMKTAKFIDLAYFIWDNYSMPIRVKNDTVYRIWSPIDIMGSPIIKSISLTEYLKRNVINNVEESFKFSNSEKKTERMNNIIGLLAFIIIVLLIIMFYSKY